MQKDMCTFPRMCVCISVCVPRYGGSNMKNELLPHKHKQNWKGDRNTKQTVSGLLAVISSAYLAMMENIAFSTLNRFAVPCGWKQF